MNRAAAIEQLFADCFYERYRTRLQGGAAEPLYTPAGDGEAMIYYREDFAASALHEVAHWCIAGEGRRQLEDYGYWYAADGRDEEQQRAFETVEVRPQAVEWHLALAAGVPFRVSVDNLDAPATSCEEFAHSVLAQARLFCRAPLPPRAAVFRAALARRFQGPAVPGPDEFQLPGDEVARA
ncbi:MAG: elongation factor P hydroxylase [Halieaceae bacterium]|nr:elongation factor P hydroxylase [Halieaceae bacterium]